MIDREADATQWKAAAAAQMKWTTPGEPPWLAEQLNMGQPICVSQYMSLFRKQGGGRKNNGEELNG